MYFTEPNVLRTYFSMYTCTRFVYTYRFDLNRVYCTDVQRAVNVVKTIFSQTTVN